MTANRPRGIPMGSLTQKAFAALLVLATLGVAARASAQFSIVSTSGSVMYTDFSNGLDSNYLSFKVTNNSGGDVNPVWAELVASGNITNAGGGRHQIRFKPGPDGADPIAETNFPNGATKGVFFMVTAGATSTTPQSLTVNLWGACSNADPVCAGGTLSIPLGSQSFSFVVTDTLQANSNKVNTVVTVPAIPLPGDLGTVAVSGCTGTVGSANVVYFSPVTQSAWVPDLFEFVDSDVDIPGYPGNHYKDITLIPPADVAANTTDHCYTDTFTFVINGFGSGSVSPNNFIASGTPIKHTTPGTGSFDVVIPELDLSVVKTQTSPLPANNPVLGGTNVTYHIAVHNAGPPDATNLVIGDSFTVGSATFVSVTNVTGGIDCSTFTALPGQCTKATFVAGADASFDLTVTVPNDGTTTITNTATVASDVQDSNSANDSSSVETTICPAIDLSVTKTATDLACLSTVRKTVCVGNPITTIQGGNDFFYHIVVANNDLVLDATNVLFTDALPVGVTYVSDTATCSSGTIAANDCNLGTINANTSVAFDIRVTAVNSGTIDNTASAAADQCDPNTGNNSALSEITVETNNIPVALEADREDCQAGDPDCAPTVTVLPHFNRVFEPNETARVDPSWKNTLGNDEPDVLGTASLLTGPGDGSTATYVIDDSTADYGPIPAGATSDCNTATGGANGPGDCYEFTITQNGVTRPHNADHPRHWDANFHEALNTGETFDWELHVGDSFPDVPRSDPFYRFVETIFHNHITIGCQSGNIFCPFDHTTRQEMAAFISRSILLKDVNVPVVTADYDCANALTPVAGQFVDVPATNGFCKYANYLKTVHVTNGCTDTVHYCPLAEVPRSDMAIFIARAYMFKATSTTTPDADVPQWKQSADLSREYNCTGSDQIDPDTLNSIPANTKPLSDVSTAAAYCKHVGFLFTTTIQGDSTKFIIDGTTGNSSGQFLPGNLIIRDETAKFLANAFGDLPLYGPLVF